jgi:tRNA1Val (adenine37-N6)-methyltransferase
MKVGTDGVLLGAWANAETAAHILDVGTGTGLIALMLAQRSATADIDAIDISPDAFLQAESNVAVSPFAHRITVHLASLAEHRRAHAEAAHAYPYDLIVSNPPYFNASLKSPQAQRNLARHDDRLPLTSLLADAAAMLADRGKLALILPPERFDAIRLWLPTHGLRLTRLTQVLPRAGLPPKRILFELCRNGNESDAAEPAAATLVLESPAGSLSPAYRQLTAPYYL